MKKLNLNIAMAKKILFQPLSFLLFAYVLLSLPLYFLSLLVQERNKESTADFDAVLFLAEYFPAEIGAGEAELNRTL
jgi:hypothetical protein